MTYADLEIGIHRALDNSYEVELRYTNPDSESQFPPERAPAPIDPSALAPLQFQPLDYGKLLSAQLFADPKLAALFGKIKVAAAAQDLRLRLVIDASAADLHLLRWELLTDPETRAPIATSTSILFSRFMTCASWTKVQLRRKPDLKALIAVANGTNLASDFDMAPILVDNEIANVQPALATLTPTIFGKDAPLTIDNLLESLDKGVDILYLVCHGALTDTNPTLYLQKDNGKVAVVDGGDLAKRISQLEYLPRLIVLASCESAGREDVASAAQSSFATRLAEAGVPAVLAMQGKVSVNSIQAMMPVFFAELMRDGQIDRALAVARRAIERNSDGWMPALFLRLKRGCLWYVPGFAGAAGKSAFQQWSSICTYVSQGKIIPIVGPDLGEHIWGSAQEQALAIAEAANFPLGPEEKVDLAKVTQYVSTTNSPAYARDQLGNIRFSRFKEKNKAIFAANPSPANPGALLDMVVAARRQDPTDPYKILADLNARIYVSASADSLLERFLKANDKTPNAKFCKWRDNSTTHPAAPLFEGEPTASAPYLYYAFGSLANQDSLVVTEDDFFDYLISASRYELMPTIVSGSMMENSLLFLGFSLSDWKFRVFFRLLMAFGGRVNMENFNHVGVQIDPDDHTLEDVEMAREYLSRYFRRANIDIYWGTSSEFLTELAAQRKAIPVNEEESAPRDVDLSAFG